MLCYGTRPQVIKAAVLADVLSAGNDLVTVDTGQHYDYELNRLLYEQLCVRTPDHCLDVGSSDAATQTAAILSRAGAAIATARPRAVVVIGDTNSTLGCALAAAQLGIPVIHVEAGLRSGDPCMLEELNRRVVDGMSALLCAPSERAAETLRSEAAHGLITVTGDVARDVLLRSLSRVPPPDQVAELAGCAERAFVFATMHRAELVDVPPRLAGVIEALGTLETPVVFAAHPRTAAALAQGGMLRSLPPTLRVVKPLGYLETVAAIRAAAAVITDSGGVQREAYWVGTPCITVRTETEWAETVEAGANTVVDPADAGRRLAALVRDLVAADGTRKPWKADALGDGSAAVRVSDAIKASFG
jgi:UDP-N-acetylglucosamine 2-epimerase